MNRILRTALAAVLIGVITVCAILLAQKGAGRLRGDFTENNLYTLSGGTREILGGLNQPVRLTLYYARSAAPEAGEGIRAYNSYFLYVNDLLKEYEELAPGRLHIEVVDPLPFTDEEERAIRDGVLRIPLPNTKNKAFFFGLVARTELGKVKAIPFFAPDRRELVEYDISKLVSDVTRAEKKRIGVLSSLPVLGEDLSPYMRQMMQAQGRQPEQPWALASFLRESYELKDAAVVDGAFASAYDFLLVIHPKELDEPTRFAIDQFVMNGGRAIIFVDPNSFADQPENPNPMMDMQYKPQSNLEAFAAWGVRFSEPDAIAVDPALAAEVPLQRNANPVAFPPFLVLGRNQVQPEEPITAELNQLELLFAGELAVDAPEGASATTLLHTSPTGGTWTPSNPYELMQPDPKMILRAMKRAEAPIPLAVLLSGALPTNFPGGIDLPAEDAGEDPGAVSSETADPAGDGDEADAAKEKPRHLEARAAAEDARVIVVADVDMLSYNLAFNNMGIFGTSPLNDNVVFVLNAIDYLAGDPRLIAVRSRGGGVG